MKAATWMALVIGTLFLISGCGGSPQEPCSSNLDCDACQLCIDGTCVNDPTCADPCQGVFCNAPPANECIDVNTLRAYHGMGECTGGDCVYTFEELACEQGCESGSCKGDLCAGKFCDSPPSPCYIYPGTCSPSTGVCNYQPVAEGWACDDGDNCTSEDACKQGSCTGTPIICSEPPDNECLDAQTMRSYSVNGVCENGACTYTHEDITCSQGCQDAICSGNPCEHVVCDAPPGPCYAQSGSCSGGVCNYPYLNGKACDDGNACTGTDMCVSGICIGTPLICDSPPDNECVTASIMRSFNSAGTCMTDACDYNYQDVSCQHGCDDGKCLYSPCEGVVCTSPPNGCYLSAGSCFEGVCYYDYLNGVTCNDGDPCTENDRCLSGSCAGTPMMCNTPPDNRCVDSSILRAFSRNGSCFAGTCDYPYQEVACAFGCDDGYCIGDPCHGVSCESPPNGCYFSPGFCNDSGVCEYEILNGAACDDGETCTQNDTCTNGTCMGTPLACDTPPDNECADANTLRAYSSNGSCANGTCQYASQDVPCTFGCASGACQSDTCTALQVVGSADITSTYDAGYRVAIAGDGPFAVVWESDGPGYDANINVRMVQADGTLPGTANTLGSANYHSVHSVGFSGTDFAVATKHSSASTELWRFDASGSSLGSTGLGTGSSTGYSYPYTVWGDNEWSVAISTTLARVSAGGSLVQPGNNQGNDHHPAIVWTGSEYGMLYLAYGEMGGDVYFMRLSAAGSPITTPFIIGTAMCGDGCQTEPELTWTGSEFVAAWVDHNADLHRARIASGGTSVTDDTVLTGNVSAASVSMAFNANRQELGFVYNHGSTSHELTFAQAPLSGSITGTVSLDSGWGSRGSIRSHGPGYVIAFTKEQPDVGNKVQFVHYGCGSPAP